MQMRQWTIMLPALLCLNVLQAQDQGGRKSPTIIKLIHADKMKVDKSTPKGATKFVGNVQLSHQEALMYCDSAFLFDNNSLEAFGRVRVVENDSLTLRGDSLFYNGNNQVAKVRGNVEIDDKASVLTTPFLDYYRSTAMGHYFGGGTIISRKENTKLTSKSGNYYSDSKLFHFRDEVVMVHPDYTIVTDTMHYAPDQEKTWFFGPTNITSDKKKIYCEFGWFDQLADKALFIDNAAIYTSGQTMKGDTIEYDQAAKVGISRCNVMLIDSNEKFEVSGDFARYEEKDSTSYVTQRMMLKQDMDGDTFYLVADTLFSVKDTAGKRIIKTFHATVFYKSDMQGACDSLVYHTKDSVIYLHRDPILWSDKNQITADSIRLTMHKGVIDKMYMDHNAFIIDQEDSLYFNQIKGRNMIGYFKDSKLKKVDVFGNGETVYYPREEDNTMIGVNKTTCSNMCIRLDSNTIKVITFFDKPVAKLTPTDDMPAGGIKLEHFDYRIGERPVSASDLFEKHRLYSGREALEALQNMNTNLKNTTPEGP